MLYKVLSIVNSPDADCKKHQCKIETGLLTWFTLVVKNQKEAISVSKEFRNKEKIDSIILCAGFTHSDVAEIFEALNGEVAVCVARYDGPSSIISNEARKRAGL